MMNGDLVAWTCLNDCKGKNLGTYGSLEMITISNRRIIIAAVSEAGSPGN